MCAPNPLRPHRPHRPHRAQRFVHPHALSPAGQRLGQVRRGGCSCHVAAVPRDTCRCFLAPKDSRPRHVLSVAPGRPRGRRRPRGNFEGSGLTQSSSRAPRPAWLATWRRLRFRVLLLRICEESPSSASPGDFLSKHQETVVLHQCKHSRPDRLGLL